VTSYAVRKKPGAENKKLETPSPLNNVLEGRGYNFRTLLAVLRALELELPMPRPIALGDLEATN
jgi:hypothetical protein